MGRRSGGGGRGGSGKAPGGFTSAPDTAASGRERLVYNEAPMGIYSASKPRTVTSNTEIIQRRDGTYLVVQKMSDGGTNASAASRVFNSRSEAVSFARSVGNKFPESRSYTSVSNFFSSGRRMNARYPGTDVNGRSFDAGTPIIYNRGLTLVDR